MNVLLIALLVLPLLGAAATLAPAGLFGPDTETRDRRALRFNAVVTGLVLALAVALAAAFDHAHPSRMQGVVDTAWIPAIGVRFHLGVDGVSLPLVVLTALLTFLCALYSTKRLPHGAGTPSARAYTGLFLLLEVGMLATFLVLDLLLFFLAFEIVLIPMYFLIARWGSGARTASANRFILYTLLGSAVMLLGFLLVGLKTGTFDMTALAAAHGHGLSHGTQVVAALAIGLGLLVKAPGWPLHSWLPDAHTAAPTTGSVLLAGVLLKMGTYGLVRVLLPIVPSGTATLAPYLGALAAVGIVYGSLACLALTRPGRKGDLKRLIAYSSVGHMGFVLLGIASLTPVGVNGALFANIAHGLVTGLLFFIVGALKDRYGTADLDTLSGATGAALYGRAPRLGALLAFAAVASLGLPGLAGFWGEVLAMFGAFDPAAGLSRPAFVTYMVLAGLGTLLTAAYLLIVVRRVCMGDPTQPAVAQPAELRPYEAVSWTPLAALSLLAGCWPALLLGLSDPAVKQLLAGG
ncbi:NADH-quinone oxidoreductase subunit M [Kitasatospora sp. NBC_01287]|uniref:complex I subunit 4 family protein n=1 Tax=Kitasatospora sp. NBC_01287 TaxID=2903573 RepID=UPI002251435B|nr:NADH-quinone oxidoreductase subunit M [Kitasatospora sp. NBC_01287]MCX4748389.1 NADH-quinone oxidoreductase subunit M [Kitasatospora sp. NBC_01287]